MREMAVLTMIVVFVGPFEKLNEQHCNGCRLVRIYFGNSFRSSGDQLCVLCLGFGRTEDAETVTLAVDDNIGTVVSALFTLATILGRTLGHASTPF